MIAGVSELRAAIHGWRHRLLVVGLAAGVALAAFASLNKEAEPVSKGADSRMILAENDVAEVVSVALDGRIAVTGVLDAVHKSWINSPLDAEVSEVLARAGSFVDKDDVLLRFDATDFQLRLNERTAALNGSRAQLALANSTLSQQRAMFDRHFISTNALQTAENAVATAAARVSMDQALVALAQRQVDKLVIRAPMGGQVVERKAEPGERVAINTPLLRIIDVRDLEFQATVAPDKFSEIQMGQQVRLRVEGAEEEWVEGVVARVGSSADPVHHRIPVYISVANPNLTLKAGLFAHAEIATAVVGPVTAVPLNAVRTSADGSLFVWLIRSGRLSKHEVESGAQDSAKRLVAVTGGLAVGDRVVIAPADGLLEGQAIKLGARP